jgi:hypothetical protein
VDFHSRFQVRASDVSIQHNIAITIWLLMNFVRVCNILVFRSYRVMSVTKLIVFGTLRDYLVSIAQQVRVGIPPNQRAELRPLDEQAQVLDFSFVVLGQKEVGQPCA